MRHKGIFRNTEMFEAWANVYINEGEDYAVYGRPRRSRDLAELAPRIGRVSYRIHVIPKPMVPRDA